MTQTRPAWDELSADERETLIRSRLATIRKAWPILSDPPAPAGGSRRPAPASRIPTNSDALSLRAEITHDLAFWVRSLLEDHPDGLSDDRRPLDLSDVPAMVDHLLAEVRWAAGWEHGYRLQWELSDLAHDAAVIAWPRDRSTILLGECTNTIGVDGTPVECGTKVRATPGNAEGDIRCRGCGKTDTIDGWLLAMVGHEKPVSVPQLRVILHQRLGIAVDEKTLRRWHKSDRIPSCGGTPGKPLFDRRQVMAALMAEEETRRRHALMGG